MKCQLKFPQRSHIEVTVDDEKVINIPLSRGNVKRTLIPLTNGQSFEISGTESERANDDAVFVHIKYESSNKQKLFFSEKLVLDGDAKEIQFK